MWWLLAQLLTGVLLTMKINEELSERLPSGSEISREYNTEFNTETKKTKFFRVAQSKGPQKTKRIAFLPRRPHPQFRCPPEARGSGKPIF